MCNNNVHDEINNYLILYDLKVQYINFGTYIFDILACWVQHLGLSLSSFYFSICLEFMKTLIFYCSSFFIIIIGRIAPGMRDFFNKLAYCLSLFRNPGPECLGIS